MSIAAGKLRHRIAIQEYRYVSQDSVTGEEKREWTTVHECWAEIAPLSARDMIAAQAAQSKVTARITIRHFDGIDASMRVVHTKRGRDVIYEVDGVLADPVSGVEYQTLVVAEGVSVSGQ